MPKKISPIDQKIINKIFIVRDTKVMLDFDLAELYQTETKSLKRQVKRNIARFPIDFMFELTINELKSLRYQIGTSNSRGGIRYLPMAFTEQGVVMLSSILNSEKAIEVNIQIIRIFTKMRTLLMDTTILELEIEKIKKKLDNHDKNIELVSPICMSLLQNKRILSHEKQLASKNNPTSPSSNYFSHDAPLQLKLFLPLMVEHTSPSLPFNNIFKPYHPY